jgi:hypothetical protein
MTRPFDRSFAPPKNPCPEFELREGTIKELIASDWPGKNRIGGFTYNTKAGARCCIGRINGKIISFTFMTTLQFRDPVTAILIRPEPGQVYQFEGEIRPGDRGRAYGYHHSIHYAAKMLREGFREAICLVEPSNMNSWKLHLSMGFEPKRICRHCHFLSRFAIIRWSAYTGSGNKFTQRKSP